MQHSLISVSHQCVLIQHIKTQAQLLRSMVSGIYSVKTTLRILVIQIMIIIFSPDCTRILTAIYLDRTRPTIRGSRESRMKERQMSVSIAYVMSFLSIFRQFVILSTDSQSRFVKTKLENFCHRNLFSDQSLVL